MNESSSFRRMQERAEVTAWVPTEYSRRAQSGDVAGKPRAMRMRQARRSVRRETSARGCRKVVKLIFRHAEYATIAGVELRWVVFADRHHNLLRAGHRRH